MVALLTMAAVLQHLTPGLAVHRGQSISGGIRTRCVRTSALLVYFPYGTFRRLVSNAKAHTSLQTDEPQGLVPSGVVLSHDALLCFAHGSPIK